MLTVKELFKKAVVEILFPAMDKAVVAWNTPFQIDDFLWANFKNKIQEKLELFGVTYDEQTGIYTIGNSVADAGITLPFRGISTFSIKELLKTFVATYIFPEVDKFCKELKTPFNLDDRLWAMLKGKILEELENANWDSIK